MNLFDPEKEDGFDGEFRIVYSAGIKIVKDLPDDDIPLVLPPPLEISPDQLREENEQIAADTVHRHRLLRMQEQNSQHHPTTHDIVWTDGVDGPRSVFDKILSADDNDETDDDLPLFQINMAVGAFVSCSFDGTYFLQARSVSYFRKLFLRAGFVSMRAPRMPQRVYVEAPLYKVLCTVLQSIPYKIRPHRVPSDHVYPLARYLRDPSVLPAFSWV